MRAAVLALVGLVAMAGSGAHGAPRIVALDQCADQYVLALAPRAEIAGLSRRALNGDSYLRAQAVGLAELRPTLESVLGARATIAVSYWSADARLAAALRRRGVAVAQIDDADTFAGVTADVRKIAAALGQPEAGERVVARMNAELTRSRGAWGGRRALYLTPGGFTAGSGTLVGAMLLAAGLAPAASAAGYAPVSLEGLVLRPPAALVLGFFRDLEGGRQRWTIAGDGYLRSLVRERAIASLPGSLLGCPAWFAADGAAALAAARPARAD